jgi:2-succinyl-5-enolpyruvyl-6-hydroxy-3-cyclohexene-1-carboxylate synthase
VVNNQGGGIFRILPGYEENEIFSTFFETKHNLTAKHLAQMYGFSYLDSSDLDSLNKNLILFHESTKPIILEVFTPSMVNDQVLKAYFNFLSSHESLH